MVYMLALGEQLKIPVTTRMFYIFCLWGIPKKVCFILHLHLPWRYCEGRHAKEFYIHIYIYIHIPSTQCMIYVSYICPQQLSNVGKYNVHGILAWVNLFIRP